MFSWWRLSLFFPLIASFMGSIHVGVGGNWKEIIEPSLGINPSWKNVIESYVGVGGVWKRFFKKVTLPENMICFFTSTPSSPWAVLNGVAASPDLTTNQVLSRGGTAQGGSESGDNTHTHSAHSGNSGDANQSGGLAFNPLAPPWPGQRAHQHSVNHSHSATSHIPAYHTLIPAKCNGAAIPVGGILFWDGASGSIPTGWSAYSALYDKYIRCSTTAGSTGGSPTHTHSYSGPSGSTAPGATNRSNVPGAVGTFDTSVHTHSIDHTHPATNHEPEYYTLIPIMASSAIGEIASGICAFFVGSTVPDGWILHATIQNGKFVKCASSAGTIGGSNSHAHNDNFNTGDTSGGSSTSTPNDGICGSPHNHSMNHSHDLQNNIPLHRVLMICKKD